MKPAEIGAPFEIIKILNKLNGIWPRYIDDKNICRNIVLYANNQI